MLNRLRFFIVQIFYIEIIRTYNFVDIYCLPVSLQYPLHQICAEPAVSLYIR